jgi:hypothetical protein
MGGRSSLTAIASRHSGEIAVWLRRRRFVQFVRPFICRVDGRLTDCNISPADIAGNIWQHNTYEEITQVAILDLCLRNLCPAFQVVRCGPCTNRWMQADFWLLRSHKTRLLHHLLDWSTRNGNLSHVTSMSFSRWRRTSPPNCKMALASNLTTPLTRPRRIVSRSLT